jgi:murein DD-endopeptidase MepM/ murein hydrolase activator NlpD
MAAPKATVTVAKGDTLSAIAKANNTTVAAIAAANPQITNVNVIKPNQVIALPAATPSKTTSTTPNGGYTTGSGVNTNTLAGIAAASAAATSKTTSSASTSSATTSKTTSSATTSKATTSSTTSSTVKTVVGTYEDPVSGDIYQVWSDGTKTLLASGTREEDAAAVANKAAYDAQQAALSKQAQEQADKRDAFALIQDTMRAYGFTDTELSELSGFIEKSIIDPNVGPNQAILNMRNLAVYQGRFAGNKTRLDKGLNALSEADYLQQEKDYGQYFQQYGVANLATRAQMATMIGNDIAPTEAKTRIGLAVDRVKNSDPQVMAQLKTYYPTLTDADLVTYFLKPEQVLPELQKKVTASEIGAAAVGQNLATTNALDLANYGVDRATALAGYSDIKSVLPTSGKLSDIYGEANIKYDQTAAESEFFKQNQDAAEKRRRLKSMERASFTGATSANLSRTQQGQF